MVAAYYNKWRTIGRGLERRHILIRSGYARRPRVKVRLTTHYIQPRLKYRTAEKLLRSELPAKKELIDKLKTSVISEVRKRFGDDVAYAIGLALDNVIPDSIGKANWKVGMKVGFSRSEVNGSASGEFIFPLKPVWFKLPEVVPIQELYAKVSFGFRGDLRKGSLELTNIQVECGFSTPL